MASVDFEGYQRAWRLRHSSADDELMRQVFGEELGELQKKGTQLLDVARSYFPHLTSSTYEALAREPDTLRLEKDRCEREMEQLAVQNYSAFIGSAEVTRGVRQELSSIHTELQEMAELLEPTQETISRLKDTASGLGARRAALRNVLAQHGALLELLELPQLLDACVRNQMYEESLELLAFCNSLLQAHEARGEDINVLTHIKDQVAVQKTNLRDSLAAQLKTDIHLPACVRIVGFLRRVQRHSEEELRELFIQHRSKFLDTHKQQVELLRHSRGSVGTALRNAADLLRTHVYDIGTQYKALFPQDDGPLGTWLNSQVMWLMTLLRHHVMPSSSTGKGSTTSLSAKIDAAQLTTVLRQCVHASSTLKRLGGHFFPAVAAIFEARMEHYSREMLDSALLTFHAELGRYDWVPSTALGGSEASGWLHPQALELTRHRPLAVLTNDIVQVFNELRQCALHGLRVSVVTHCYECCMASVNLLRSVLASQTLRSGSPKAAEFHKLCRHFADILVPLVASHLEALFGSAARLDSSTIVSSMVPDLIQAEVEYTLPPEAPEQADVPSVAVDEASPSPAPAQPEVPTEVAAWSEPNA
ncbi:COG8 [Symbiodinium natans]|uniref:Conserved oligomeric Golgi complex subunit 8 n=1 Tax=Symbiodinium natans TaxID=878477 RepID=A0A812PD71_9DINO|nr:COG8 [Symbiodinium natans]